jgi:ATP-dependent Lhr-like helicase
VLERDVLPARMAGYTPRLLDELGAAGEVVWIGRGSLGRDDGRIALYRRDRVDLLASAGTAEERPADPIHDAIREHLKRRGASFFAQLRAAVPRVRGDEELLDAMWDLVWAGEVTNDTFAALRALALPRSRSKAASRRPGRILSLGPPRAAGRWSLVAELVGEGRSPTERGHALATTLLERHGVVTREAVASEGIPGGYAAVYPVLRAMEESGRARRGYFVAGLGAAQFALPGAVDRLRAVRDDEPSVAVLAATDPAQPYGAALPWPRDDDDRLPLQRAAGAYVVLVDGRAVLYLERGGRGLLRMPAAAESQVLRAITALPSLVAPGGPMRELRLERVDRGPVADSPLAGPLRDAGFRPSYRGYLLRRSAR